MLGKAIFSCRYFLPVALPPPQHLLLVKLPGRKKPAVPGEEVLRESGAILTRRALLAGTGLIFMALQLRVTFTSPLF